jgi:hypothetical protein
MSNFGLSIGSHDFHLCLEWLPLFSLLIGHHILDSESKHGVVKDTHVLSQMSVSPDGLVALMLFKPLAISVEFLSSLEFLHMKFPHFFLSHVIELMSVL